MDPQIMIQGLSKEYRVPEREPGLRAALGSLIRPHYRSVLAVDRISLSVQPGEIVGFIGPNGAGKTSTLKMLAGLMVPTAGTLRVAGFVPWERKPGFLHRIGMVMGNRSQMLWDIPPLDSFHLLGEIYGLSPASYRETLDELVGLLDMGDILNKPVRNLSLGERMKCELVAGLIHRPQVLFLDEPTLGLDVSMQIRLRSFLAEYNRKSGVTMILTSHYMADVMALCPRVILIHHGRLLYDGELGSLAQQLAPYKLLRVTFREHNGGLPALPAGAEIAEQAPNRLTLRAQRTQAPAITAYLLQTLSIIDLIVEDPPIEAVIDRIYQEGQV